MFIFSPSSLRRLDTAHPVLKLAMLDSLQVSTEDFGIASCFRDEEEQNAKFEMERSKARWGESAHNTVDSRDAPMSMGLDFFIAENGIAIWGGPRVERQAVWLSGFLAAKGIPVKLGLDFTNLHDPGHLEMVGWENYIRT